MRWAGATFVVLSLAGLCCGLFEDQVGKFDWTRTNIGQITWSEFLTVNQQSRILAASKYSIALLDTKSGDVKWRQVFSDGNFLASARLNRVTNEVYTVHKERNIVRSWDVSSGILRMEVPFPTDQSAIDIVSTNDNQAFVSTQSGLFSISQDESRTWNSLHQAPATMIGRKVIIHANEAFLLTISEGKLEILALNKLTGEKNWETTVLDGVISSQCSVASSYLICFKGSSAKFIRINTANKSGMKSLSPDSEISRIESLKDAYIVLYFTDGCASIFELSESGAKLIKHFPAVSFVVAPYAAYIDDPVFAVFHKTGGKSHLTLISSETEQLFEGPVEIIDKVSCGSIQNSAMLIGKSGIQNFKLFLSMEDHTAVMIQSGDSISWKREEALSEIINVEMCDLQLSELQMEIESEFEVGGSQSQSVTKMFLRRIFGQAHQVLTYIQHAYEAISEGTLFSECSAEKDSLVRDKFNVNKMILAVTSNGKLFGIMSSTGNVVWSHYLPYMDFTSQASFLLVQRSTTHYEYSPIAVLVGKNRANGNVAMFSFNPITGQEISTNKDLGFKALLVIQLPNIVDDEFMKAFAILDTEYRIRLYPSSSEQSFTKYTKEKLFVTYFPTAANELSGVRISESGTGSLAWSQNFGQFSIQGIYPKRINEKVDCPGRVLGDRSVLFKYLNANLAVVVLEASEDAPADLKGSCDVLLIDSVTGETIFSASHKKVSCSEIKLVHSENWIVYSLWNERFRRTELSVLELFESGRDKIRNGTHFSSFDNSTVPMVMRQSYIFPLMIRSLSTTYSEKGLTNKRIIVGTDSGKIFALPKALLDPRRSLTPTQMDREEGLPPYHPEIPIATDGVINYNQTVEMIRASYTYPGGLESTVLVFTYGLDIFFTLVFPSEQFDVLKDDFEFWLISLVCSALFIATGVTRKLAAHYNLKKAWK